MDDQRIEAEAALKPRFLGISKEIEEWLGKDGGDLLLVAIDGQCASGKTTLARMLARKFDCNLFHMDDFFLRPKQRTRQRLSEVGGNVDYERFWREVLEPVLRREEVSYRVYDCRSRQFAAEQRKAPVKRVNLVEGSYSRHPYFGDCYHLAYCLQVEEEEQKRRILKRNGAGMLKRFTEEWIPKENAYLKTFGIWNEPFAGPKEESSYAANQRID